MLMEMWKRVRKCRNTNTTEDRNTKCWWKYGKGWENTEIQIQQKIEIQNVDGNMDEGEKYGNINTEVGRNTACWWTSGWEWTITETCNHRSY